LRPLVDIFLVDIFLGNTCLEITYFLEITLLEIISLGITYFLEITSWRYFLEILPGDTSMETSRVSEK